MSARMVVHPTVRAPRDEHARPDYLEYLKTASWRATRNRALSLAHYRCARCDAKRDLQVHHLSYERLGHEWDQDLEVLCDACHAEHHAIARAQHGDSVRLFAVFAGQAIHDRRVTTDGDLVEAVKVLAARHGVPYDSGSVWAAVDLVTGKRAPFAARRTVVVDRPAPAAPINKIEAMRIVFDLCTRYDLPLLRLRIRTMPGTTAEAQRAHEDKLRRQQADIRAATPDRPLPLHERLAAVFA